MSQRIAPSWRSGNYARSAGESKYPNAWRGLVGTWRPSMGNQGLLLRDWSNNGNPCNLVSTGYVAGRIGLANSFGGSNYGLIQLTASSLIETNHTIGQWIYATASTGRISFCRYRWATSGEDIIFFLSGSNFTYGLSNTTGATATFPGLNQWVFVVGTYNGSLGTLYINGEPAATHSITRTAAASDDPIVIGADADSSTPSYGISNQWIGRIEETFIYSRAWSPPEVMTYYLGLYDPLQLRERVTYFVPTVTAGGTRSIITGGRMQGFGGLLTGGRAA